MKLTNVKSSQPTFKSSPPNYKCFHKFAHSKFEPMPDTLNLVIKKAFATKLHSKDASGLITIIGMLTIWKDL